MAPAFPCLHQPPASTAMTVGSIPAKRSLFLPFSPPVVGEEEIQEVVDTLRSSWITTGPKTGRFEADFASYLGAPGALALNSCTAALQELRDRKSTRLNSSH